MREDRTVTYAMSYSDHKGAGTPCAKKRLNCVCVCVFTLNRMSVHIALP